MIAKKALVLALSLVLGGSSWARAQTAGGTGPGAQTGAGPTGPGGSSTVAIDKDTDLPLEAPPPAQAKPKPPTPPDNPPPTTPQQTPPTIYGKDLKTENGTVFYVIDVSGSMGWDMGQYTAPDGSTQTGCRLDRAKAELTKSVVSLPKTFKFNMLSYDCSTYPWQSSLQPADDGHKADAISWINQLQPQGATGTGPAMVTALTGCSECKLFVLFTDGGPNCGAGNESGNDSCKEAHRDMIRAANTQKAVINVFGISAYDSMKVFCMEVAQDSGGQYIDVPQ